MKKLEWWIYQTVKKFERPIHNAPAANYAANSLREPKNPQANYRRHFCSSERLYNEARRCSRQLVSLTLYGCGLKSHSGITGDSV